MITTPTSLTRPFTKITIKYLFGNVFNETKSSQNLFNVIKDPSVVQITNVDDEKKEVLFVHMLGDPGITREPGKGLFTDFLVHLQL